jgi:hypothetical protein
VFIVLVEVVPGDFVLKLHSPLLHHSLVLNEVVRVLRQGHREGKRACHVRSRMEKKKKKKKKEEEEERRRRGRRAS